MYCCGGILTKLLPAERASTGCLVFTLSKHSRYGEGREGGASQKGLAKREEKQGRMVRRDRLFVC